MVTIIKLSISAIFAKKITSPKNAVPNFTAYYRKKNKIQK